VDFRLSLDFFDSGLYTRTAVARLTLALAKLSCFVVEMKEKKGLLHKEGREVDVIVVDGREKSPSFVSVERPPNDRYALSFVINADLCGCLAINFPRAKLQSKYGCS